MTNTTTDNVVYLHRRADRATRLKKGEDDTKAKIAKASKRLARIQETLESLHESVGSAPSAEEAVVRARQGSGGPSDLEGLSHE